MSIVERNDVDLSKLFVWGKKFEIVDKDEEMQATVYMRLLGDADVNRARVYALRKSRELRLKLLDPNSDERMLYIQTLDELTKEDLYNYITMFSMREITNRAFKEVRVEKPKQPKSNAPLKKMEEYQKQIDDYPKKLDEAIKKFIKKEVESLKSFLEKEDKEVLYKRYMDSIIEEFCEQEALKAYRDYELYLGCYKDEDYKIRAWESFEEFDNLPTEVKQNFRAAYETLDIKMDELKKLREATQ